MATGQLNGVGQQLRRSMLRHDAEAMTDGQLLDCFITQHDEAAFAALVRRHGPMVLGVCRRLLRHAQDAEDAFQATFLVFARKAASLTQRELVANWLFGTAYRAALEAGSARRRRKEKQVSALPDTQQPDSSGTWSELRPLLDQELNRLPDRYRVPIVLCDLEGRTRREAARQLGIPEGTLSGRLTTARRTLAQRLARRGVVLSGAALATALSTSSATACVPAALVIATTRAVMPTAVVSTGVAALTEGVLKTMLLIKLKSVAVGLLLAGLLTFGVGTMLHPMATAQPTQEKPLRVPEKKPDTKEPAEPLTWQVQATLKGHTDRVHCVKFTRDGKKLATASWDGDVRLWDVTTGKLLTTLKGHEGPVYRVTFSPDEKTIATAGEDKTARIWDMRRGVELQKVTHDMPVYSVAFTPDGKTLVVGGGHNDPPRQPGDADNSQGELKLWDPATGNQRSVVNPSHNNRVTFLAFTPDGKTIITGGHDNTFKVWDWDGKETLKEKRSVEGGQRQGLYGIALSPDGKTVALTSDGGIAKLYDVASGKQSVELEKSNGMWAGVTFTPDGKTVIAEAAIQERDGDFVVQRRALVRLWDVTTGKVRETVKVDMPTDSVGLSPDGKILVVGGKGKLKMPAEKAIRPDDIEKEPDGTVQLLTLKKQQPKK